MGLEADLKMKAHNLEDADCVYLVPTENQGVGSIVPLSKAVPGDQSTYRFTYNKATYTVSSLKPKPVFAPLPYPCDSAPTLSSVIAPPGIQEQQLSNLYDLYGTNEFDVPIPKFMELFLEHCTAPFFVFQVFCVALWMLDEYWYYSLFTLFMLVMFECTVVYQRLRTLTEFRTMSVEPYPILVRRDGKWTEISTSMLLPGDVVSLARANAGGETVVPADVLLLGGTAIVNEAMLSGESTPLLKESARLLPPDEALDADLKHRGQILFSGTKVLQASPDSKEMVEADLAIPQTPDGGAPALVLRTGFGTAQGGLVRTMLIGSTRAVGAGSFEAFLFIGFLLIFALAASWYVWTRGIERDLKKSKLLLDCVLIITSVVPPELPMELSLSVNASLVALSKFAIFCTEPFRIPFAGRVDVCCFDKTGTITAEDLICEGVVGVE